MSLWVEQVAFGQDLFKLLNYINQLGYAWVLGEVQRPVEMQKIYVETGRSKTMLSDHLHKTAADIHIFTLEGELVLDSRLQPLGDYWQSLNPKNRWGGNWSSFKDMPHFERHL